jgi:hypothetical protein
MTKRWAPPDSELTVLRDLAEELERASNEQARPRWLVALLRSGRRSVALATIAVFAIGAAAAAATGVLSTGAVIRAGKPSGPPENRKRVSQTVLAQGTSPVAGPWRITVYGSEGLADDGEVLEPRGLPCVELALTDPPVTPSIASSFCGNEIPTEFMASSLGVGDGMGHGELILYGTVPEEATTVTLVGDGATRIPAQLFDGPDGYGGDVWAVSVGRELKRAMIRWTRADGKAGAPSRDVTDSFDRLGYFRQTWKRP